MAFWLHTGTLIFHLDDGAEVKSWTGLEQPYLDLGLQTARTVNPPNSLLFVGKFVGQIRMNLYGFTPY